jgi:murein DD-endopeptidase MepM/ murein hydrolase activator NlpD
MHRYEEAQLDALRAREVELRQDQDRVAAQIAATEVLVSSKQQRLDAIVRAAYRSSRITPLEEILESGSLVDGIARTLELSRLGEEERQLVERLRTLGRDLDAQRARLAADADELSRVTESLQVKHDVLRTLADRARRITEAQRAGGERARIAAEIDVVRELAAEQERASAQLQEVVRKLVPFVVQPSALWTWPSSGAISQPFGPSSLELEPPVEYQGVRYRHFHAALDLAAPLLSPVVAAADGRVAFVGHFTDGAMVVLIAHADGYLSLYAHLDDGLRPPVVRVGDDVQAGQIVGAIGLTGITTGPHLHFAVMQGNAPVDPLALLPTRE